MLCVTEPPLRPSNRKKTIQEQNPHQQGDAAFPIDVGLIYNTNLFYL